MTIKDLVPRFGRGKNNLPVQRGEWDPFREFQRDINRLFDDFIPDLSVGAEGRENALTTAGFTPRIDVSETDHEIKVSAELPGMDEKDITVEIDDSCITVRGEKHDEKEDSGKNWYRREQTYGSFRRVIPLPVCVDSEKAKAKFKKGILGVSVPKIEEEKTNRKAIAIESD